MNKVGPCEELTIFYHPITSRHLGFARVVFQDVKHSKLCIEKYHGKSVMGQVSYQCSKWVYLTYYMLFVRFDQDVNLNINKNILVLFISVYY